MRKYRYIPEDYKPEIAALKDIKNVFEKTINIQHEFDVWIYDNMISIYIPYRTSLPYKTFAYVKEVCDIHGVSVVVHANRGSFTFELVDSPSQKRTFIDDPDYIRTFASNFVKLALPEIRENLEEFIEEKNIDDPSIIEELLTSAEERLVLSARDLGKIVQRLKAIRWNARIGVDYPIVFYSLVPDKDELDVRTLLKHWPKYRIDVFVHKCRLEDLLDVFDTSSFEVYFAPIKGRFYVTAVWKR